MLPLRRSRASYFTFWEWACLVACIFFFVLVIAWFVHDHNQRKACRDHGGHVVEYNCRTVIHCHTVGKSTTCYPSKTCDWCCEGLPAEAPRSAP